jgi:hypothetical protein
VVMNSEKGMTSSGEGGGTADSGCGPVPAGRGAASAGTSSSLITDQPTAATTKLSASEHRLLVGCWGQLRGVWAGPPTNFSNTNVDRGYVSLIAPISSHARASKVYQTGLEVRPYRGTPDARIVPMLSLRTDRHTVVAP